MKIPTIAEPLALAREYAFVSLDHTHTYDGVPDDRKKRYERILTGQLGQQFLMKFCQLNGIDCTSDNTSYMQDDNFDLIINGHIIDVKTENSGIECQVNASLKNKQVDGYFFLKTDRKLSYIEPLGMITKDNYFNIATFVKQGEIIPNTNFKQFLPQGTYTLQSNLLTSKGISFLKSIPKKVQS